MAGPSLAIIQAIFAALRASPDVMAISKGLYDYVPEDMKIAYPYIVLGDDIIESDDYVNAATTTCEVTVRVYSQYPGVAEIRNLVDAIQAALHTNIPMNGYKALVWKPMPVVFTGMGDGLTNQAIVKVEYVIFPIN
jgi:hypothetical protein